MNRNSILILSINKISLIIPIAVILLWPASAISQIVAPENWKQENEFIETASAPKPKNVDKRSGFIPYTRNYMEPIYMNSRPRKNEITDTFHIILAQNEFEPVIIALYALKNQDNITIKIRDIKSHYGSINPKQFEIRKIESRAILPKGRRRGGKKFKLIPSILKLTHSANLIKGNTTAFWVTAHALKHNMPGTYNGYIDIYKIDKLMRTLNLQVTILPFELEEIPDKTFAVLYTLTRIPPELERNARILLKDMRNHGMTSYSPIVSAWGEPLTFNNSDKIKIRNLINHLQWAKQEGFVEPTLLNINKLIRTGRPQNDANYTKFNLTVDIPNLKRLIRLLEAERKKHDWPEIIYLPIDEPGCFTDKTGVRRSELAVLTLKTITALNVRGTTTVADLVDNKHRKIPRWKNVVGWWDKIKPYCNVRIYANGYTQGKNSLKNEKKDAALHGHEVMLYENQATMGTDPYVSRMYFGFYGWRTSVKGLTSWTHPTYNKATVRHIWSGWEERKKDAKRYLRDKNWILPPTTVCWEMVREGIDDAKYLYFLEKTLQKASISLNDLELLQELKTSIDSTRIAKKKSQCNWKGKRFTYFRQRVIDKILELLKKQSK